MDDCEVALDREEIDEWGWREAEFAEGRFTHRWTAGNTRIPPGAKAVIVDLAGFGAYWGGSNESDFSLSA